MKKNIKRSLFIAITTCSIVTTVALQSVHLIAAEATDLTALQNTLQNTLEQDFNQLSVPGVSVAIVLDNGDELTATSGTLQDKDEAITSDHRFRLASISKHLTALMIVILNEQGQLTLDDLIVDYLPLGNLPNKDTITIRQLLDHSAGVYDVVNGANNFFDIALADPDRIWLPEEILNYAEQYGADFEPGTAYGYSNTGYLLLGMLIENVTGQSLAQSFDSLLTNPLSLNDIFVDDYSGKNKVIDLLASNNRSYEYHMSAIGAAGNFVATPLALARLSHEVYVNDFISNESEELLIEGSDNNNDYGLGTRLWTVQDIFHYGHTGTLGGYKSILMYLPDYEASIVITVNGYPSNSDNWWQFIDNVFLDVVNYYDGTPAAPKPPVVVTPEQDSTSGGALNASMLVLILIWRRMRVGIQSQVTRS